MYPRTSAVRSSFAVAVVSDDDSDSMASTAATESVPAMTRGSSNRSSSDSVETDMASSILGEGYRLESHDGLLIVPHRYQPDAHLLCPFQILDCDKVFADIVHFKLHVFSHFKGHVLPTIASCFLCDNVYTQRPEDDTALAWNNMLSHMVHEHYRRGQQLATVRTNFTLMRWMYCRRIISDHQFKRTQMIPIPTLLPGGRAGGIDIFNLPHAPDAPSSITPTAILAHMSQSVGFQSEPFTMTAGRRAERRQWDSTRPISRARSYI